ncbi:ABC transporter permease [Mucilaginibacter ginsenosidivorax]|uniref:FtsX-like permease family protein n=1 Tax=Mucilaginibacter ginsenosidivorax TaxID=862126 RepID=A0A5B8W4T1_9SPHI|nr:ABC transporter permease [Mucilaginibacter ginsenosidivorax]QEC78559.1 FtsX-like permease family protein [Mucilaginibacter ginsenosidivorax]
MLLNISSLKSTFRLQKRHKGLSLISMLGIILGHIVFFLIVSYAWYEKSFDKFHQHVDEIFRVSYSRYDQGTMQYNTVNSFFPTGPYLKANCAGVVNSTTIARNYNITISSAEAGVQPFYFNEEKAYYAPSSFLSVFSYPLIKGNPLDLDKPNTVFITQSIAQKYFGNQDAIGKTIKVNGNTTYSIAGVLKNLPTNTHLKFNFLFSLPTHVNQLKKWIDITNHWYGYDLFYTYIQLKPGADPALVEKMLPVMVEKNYGDKLRGAKQRDIFALQKLTDIHLYSNLEWETEKPGNGQAINILIGFAAFILLITWVNYINLISSQAVERAKEVGIRKTLGCSNRSVLLKFFSEVVIVNIISLCIAAILLLLASFILSSRFEFFSTEIYADIKFWMIIAGITISGVLITGFIIAVVIARFNPIDVLKGKLVVTTKSLLLRKSLIAFQFIISFILITGALIVYDQSAFLLKKDKGLDHTAVLSVKFPKILNTGDKAENLTYNFKQQLKALKWVKNITIATDMPEKEIENFGSMFRPQLGASDDKAYFRVGVDDNYFNFFKIKLLAGRLFSKDMGLERNSLILNESAVKKLGFNTTAEVIGTMVNNGRTIIGVVSDFNYRSVKVKPVATMFNFQQAASYFGIKLYENEFNLKDHIAELNKIYGRIFPGNPFEYVFLDDAMKQDLQPDLDFARIFGFFSLISIVISLIGLLGLVIVDLNQRVKELGIRKVIGADLKHIMMLVMYKFSIPIGIALLIGTPISVWGFSNWINSYYVYHIAVNVWYFIIPALILPVLAASIISVQVLRVDRQKIITSLKYE